MQSNSDKERLSLSVQKLEPAKEKKTKRKGDIMSYSNRNRSISQQDKETPEEKRRRENPSGIGTYDPKTVAGQHNLAEWQKLNGVRKP